MVATLGLGGYDTFTEVVQGEGNAFVYLPEHWAVQVQGTGYGSPCRGRRVGTGSVRRDWRQELPDRHQRACLHPSWSVPLW